MENLKKRLANLLTVKSLVTLVLTAIFAVLALRESISGSDFLTIFTVVIGFYFGTQRVAKLEAENKLLREQVSAQADQAEFYEECIAEMAAIVYA